MDADLQNGSGAGTAKEVPLEALPEVELYAYLLVLILLVDSKKFGEVRGTFMSARGGGGGAAWITGSAARMQMVHFRE